MEPSSALPARSYSPRSVSLTTLPSPVTGSYALTTPCTAVPRSVSGFDDLARLDAARAHVNAARRAVHEGADALDVRVPAALRATVRVRHRHAPRRVLPTDFADSCHRPTRLPGGTFRSTVCSSVRRVLHATW